MGLGFRGLEFMGLGVRVWGLGVYGFRAKGFEIKAVDHFATGRGCRDYIQSHLGCFWAEGFASWDQK